VTQNSHFHLPSLNTLRFKSLSILDIAEDECVIITSSPKEARAQLPLWSSLKTSKDREYILIAESGYDSITVSINGKEEKSILLTDACTIEALLRARKILIDISGLAHHIWAPLLKIAFINKIPTRVLYSEPESYSPHSSPASSTLFDLSKEFGGLAPLPGFAQLSGPEDEENCIFVALLGFEGSRPRRLIYDLDPPPRVIPVVGVPGFQIEFPSFTVKCNRELLEEFEAYSDIRYAKASCPFDVLSVLSEIRRDNPNSYMYLAPIGTKPHGLGTILYSIMNPTNTEILFDHPVKKEGRTTGIGITHIYNFGAFDEL
jgi:hypothetical protein